MLWRVVFGEWVQLDGMALGQPLAYMLAQLMVKSRNGEWWSAPCKHARTHTLNSKNGLTPGTCGADNFNFLPYMAQVTQAHSCLPTL